VNPRQPRVTAAQVIRVLEKRGFNLVRQSGSHQIYKDVSGKRATVPLHSRKILHPKILRNILSDAGLTEEEFIELLKK
jgi:predicted RNA binding protein YcfA (HicA-like mRNA interferase family)